MKISYKAFIPIEERQFKEVCLFVVYIKDTRKTTIDNNDSGRIFCLRVVGLWCLVLETL
jgi:hypothetical protein